jgi:alpha,alpha-trehalase
MFLNSLSSNHILSKSAFDAVIFDLDGVVTRTAKIHREAWKRTFDEYLGKVPARGEETVPPFDPDQDYQTCLDGKPRYLGVQHFLASRGIDLPFGDPEVPPDRETVCGLGNRKNALFHKLLQRQGVEVCGEALGLILQLRAKHFKTAVVSSSKNGRKVLEAARMGEMFDVRVDGGDAEELHLPGKPAPDVFFEAARRLEVTPKRTVIVEDSIAGVQAGTRGRFGLVIGIGKGNHAMDLKEHGADLAVENLSRIEVRQGSSSPRKFEGLPSALESLEEIRRRAQGKHPAVFLDYDGTLTPIVDQPEDARLSGKAREILSGLAARFPAAVISGRDLRDIRERVGLKEIVYAGSHGFEISFPDGRVWEHPLAVDYLSFLDRAEMKLAERLGKVQGCRLERKRFSLAVHYRRVAEARFAEVEKAVHESTQEFPELRLSGGKKIYEFQPRVEWHKGKALLLLLELLHLDRQDVLPLYIGDDATDEDVFQVLQARGLGILVTEEPRSTAAHYALKDPQEVQNFLQQILPLLQGNRNEILPGGKGIRQKPLCGRK